MTKMKFTPLFLLILMCAGWTEAAVQIRRLAHPSTAFYLPALKNQEDLRKMVQVRRADIQQILTRRGMGGILDAMVQAVEGGNVQETTISPGAQLPFMSYRKRGSAGYFEDVTWAGKTSFEVYYVDFESQGTGYRLYVPKICSNFWIEQRQAPPPPPPAPTPPPPPPPPAPEPTPPPAVEIPPPPPPPEVEERGMFFIAGFVGKERLVQGDVDDDNDGSDDDFGAQCAALLGVKVGVLPRINENLEAELSAGFKLNLEEGDDSSIFIDAALNALVGRGFLGGGVSFWDLTEEDTRNVSLLLQGGVDLTETGRWQFVVEARAPFEEFDDLGNNYQFWGGIRFRP